MSKSSASTAATRAGQANFPQCLRCNKPVDEVVISPHPNNPSKVMVEFHCHGEIVEQEMPSSLLAGAYGLAGYTAFNEYTSGLLPPTSDPSNKQKGSKK